MLKRPDNIATPTQGRWLATLGWRLPALLAVFLVAPMVPGQEVALASGDESPGFGYWVGITEDGVRAIVGNYSADVGSEPYAGEVRVYDHDGSDWSRSATLTPAAPVEYAFFGWGVAIDADGDTIVVGAAGEVGTPGNLAWIDDTLGAAYVFRRVGGSWTQTRLAPTVGPSDTEQQWFGMAVAVSGNGQVVAIGAPTADDNRGAIYVSRWVSGAWTAPARVTPPALATGDALGGSRNSRIYQSLALNHDGTLLVGSATYAGSADEGAVWAWTRSGGSWSAPSAIPHGVDVGGNPDFDSFGAHVSLNADGTRLAIAAGDRVLTYSGGGTSWSLDGALFPINPVNYLTCTLDPTGDYLVIGHKSDGVGYVLARQGAEWIPARTLHPSLGGTSGWTCAMTDDPSDLGTPHVILGDGDFQLANLMPLGAPPALDDTQGWLQADIDLQQGEYDGELLTLWSDQSDFDSGNFFFQYGSSFWYVPHPTLTDPGDGVNGRSVLVFDGFNDHLLHRPSDGDLLTCSLSAGSVVFTVVLPSNTSRTQTIYEEGSYPQDGSPGFHLYLADDRLHAAVWSGNDFAGTSIPISNNLKNGVARIIVTFADGQPLRLRAYDDNLSDTMTSAASSQTFGVLAPRTSAATIGNLYDEYDNSNTSRQSNGSLARSLFGTFYSGWAYGGFICEMQLLDRALNASERQAMLDYLRGRWIDAESPPIQVTLSTGAQP